MSPLFCCINTILLWFLITPLSLFLLYCLFGNFSVFLFSHSGCFAVCKILSMLRLIMTYSTTVFHLDLHCFPGGKIEQQGIYTFTPENAVLLHNISISAPMRNWGTVVMWQSPRPGFLFCNLVNRFNNFFYHFIKRINYISHIFRT